MDDNNDKTYEVIKAINQIASSAYDGGEDSAGEELKIGLKREEGHPILNSRTVDGFQVKFSGDRLIICYQSDIKLKDVHGGKFEDDIDSRIEDVKKYLAKEFKKITKKALSLKAEGDARVLVQQTSRVRVFVNAEKTYKIGNIKLEPLVDQSVEDSYEAKFKSFLEQGGNKLGK